MTSKLTSLSSFARSIRNLILAAIFSVAGCGGGDESAVESAVGDESTNGQATLLADVDFLQRSRASWVREVSPDQWELIDTSQRPEVGQRILLLDDAVRVLALRQEGSRVYMQVQSLDVEDVFETFTVPETTDIANAVVELEPGVTMPPAMQKYRAKSALGQKATTDAFAYDKSYSFLLASSGVGEYRVDLMLSATYDYEYRREDNSKVGRVAMSANTVFFADLLGTTSNNSFLDRRIASIVVPIRTTIFDSALRRLGIRVSTLRIPIRLKVNTTAELSSPIRLQVAASGFVDAKYSSRTGLIVDANAGIQENPLGSPFIGAYNGELAQNLLTRLGRDRVSFLFSADAYIEAQPTLTLLNDVSKVGASISVGMTYAYGNEIYWVTDRSGIRVPAYQPFCGDFVMWSEFFGFAALRGYGIIESSRNRNSISTEEYNAQPRGLPSCLN